MKIFGSLSELVSAVFRKNSQAITLRPNQSTTYTAARDVQLPPQDADSVLVSANSTQTLTGKTMDGGSNTFSNITFSQTTGTLAINRGGTGQTTQTAAFDALAPSTTKGDLIAYDGSDNIRVAVGTDGQVLTADSGQTSGLTWTSPLVNPMDSAGDIIVGGALGVATKLDAGASDTVLIGGTSPSFAKVANANVSSTAAIDFSKLAALSSARLLVGSAGNVATAVDVTGDVTISNTGVTAIGTGKVTSTMILDGTIVNGDINASAAIAYSKLALTGSIVNADIGASAAIAFSKLATLSSANILVGNGSNVATAVAVTGDITLSNAGVTAIASGVIVNADVNASAAIDGTKISPAFGSQNISTTGTLGAGLTTLTTATNDVALLSLVKTGTNATTWEARINNEGGGDAGSLYWKAGTATAHFGLNDSGGTPRIIFDLDSGGSTIGLGIGRAPTAGYALDVLSNGNTSGASIIGANNSYTSTVLVVGCDRALDANYNLILGVTNTDGSTDNVFKVKGDGTVSGEGSFVTSTGADYAECFEWEDSNPLEEDRVGYTVSLVGNKIRIAEEGDTVIGVVSSAPSVLGDAAWNNWVGRYLRDDFGRPLTNEEGLRIENPEWDPEQEYIPRTERSEWSPVGLVGKLRVRVGQVIPAHWILLRQVSAEVAEYLVR